MVRFKNKKNDNTTWIALGILALMLLVGKTSFFGAIVTTCDNVEPVSIQEYLDVYDQMNGTVDAGTPFDLMNETGFVSYDTYVAQSSEVNIKIIDPGNLSCSQFLSEANIANPNSSKYLILNQRQVITDNAGFIWCNYNNNLAISGTAFDMSNYLSKFEICQTVEQTQTVYVTDATECGSLRGELNADGNCECTDGSLLEIGNICPDVEPASTTTSSPTGNKASEPSVPAPTSTSPSIGFNQVNKKQPTTLRNALVALGGLTILFLIYWFFEKGPNKGLFKAI